ncbi:MAG: hypothetical protein E7169_00240 [Firmicutes bacterium]|nr:hypothetical protein [Bacillota bacterium]
MKAKFIKRFFAYFIDILILGIILLLTSKYVLNNDNVKNLNIELDILNENYLNGDVSVSNYINHYAEISYDLDKHSIIYTIVNIIFVVIYFIIMPYLLKGQTLGMKLFKIKVVKEEGKLTLNDLFVRNLIINGLGYMIICLLLIYLLPALPYFIIMMALGLVQLVLIIICAIGIIKNNNNLILQDKLTNTLVINS